VVWLGLSTLLAGAAFGQEGHFDAGQATSPDSAHATSPGSAHATSPDSAHAVPGEAAGDHAAGGGHGEGPAIGEVLPLWSALPFAGILLSIALFPLLAPRFWHHHYPKVSLAWAVIFAIPFLIAYGSHAFHEIAHIYLIDYIPFIILLWGLFTAAGGIVVRGTLAGTPAVNSLMILIGTAVASWIGTTGASMLMIRPILRANSGRRYKVHVIVFFIFLVSNIGGSLTPLGDPPLFLGFLHGVPFFWTMSLLPHMGLVIGLVLGLFYLVDRRYYLREKRQQESAEPSVRSGGIKIEGLQNFLFLGGILGAVLLSGFWRPGAIQILGVRVELQNLARDGLILLMGALSLIATSRQLREHNEFSWGPIREVAYLFAGIFMTIIPALAILRAGEHGALAFLIEAVREPAHYFWATGVLSSFLDNAPTYLTFFSTELGRFYPGQAEVIGVAALIKEHSIYLQAVAAGAVFMGANTYIGNAPNFMVKSIAEEAGIPMPSFFGYMLRWSIPILIPIFAVVTWIFFI
jgi:Na+/H+ antiporter NhaD/arsenite permease-like protein